MTQVMALDFETEEFSAPIQERPPYAQIINPRFSKKGILPFGFALTKANAEACSFTPPDGWDLVEHEFASKSVESVYMTLSPKLVILARTPVYVLAREGKVFLGELKDIPDYWDKKKNYTTRNYAWCFILDGKNQPCHTVPLLISGTGASGASFNLAWLQYANPKKKQSRAGFCRDMEVVYAKARKQEVKDMGELFHAHCIYQPQFEADERGVAPDAALIAAVVKYQTANIDLLIPNGSELSNLIKVSRESVKDWRPRAATKQETIVATEPNNNEFSSDYDEFPPY